jgi:hypothetical protein
MVRGTRQNGVEMAEDRRTQSKEKKQRSKGACLQEFAVDLLAFERQMIPEKIAGRDSYSHRRILHIWTDTPTPDDLPCTPSGPKYRKARNKELDR